jgi:succinate-semialdehyde dehydrogenase / glutarate-semialdehyde dehydrogenase
MEPTYRDVALRIDDEAIGPDARAAADVIDPATERVIGRVPLATPADLDRAVAVTARAFEGWRRVSAYDRAGIVRRAAALLRERVEDVAVTMTLENGKTLAESRGEILTSADTLDWLADEARRSYGRVIPSRFPDGRVVVMQEPVGPVAAFTPWNAAGLTSVRKIGSAIAAGCSIVLKPAEETPGTAQHLFEAFRDAGLPAGVLQIVYGDPAEVSQRLLTAPEIRKGTFTGSVAVGKRLAALAAQDLKRLTLELGGHGPVIVAADADVPRAARETAAIKFRQTGQVCAAPSRFYVHESVYAEFVAELAGHARAIAVGNGMDAASGMGPLANRRRLDAMLSFVADARARGGRVVTGGSRIGDVGFFFEPTVIADVDDAFDVMRHEIFGPIAPVASFVDVEDALRRANASELGLTAFVFTENERLARHLGNELEAGLVAVNTGGTSLPETPFGGVKHSGYGMEGGVEGLEAYTVRKLVNAL